MLVARSNYDPARETRLSLSTSLLSTAKSLLIRLKNEETASTWHGDCLQHFSRMIETYTLDASDHSEDAFSRQLELFISNLKIIVDVVAAHEADPSSIGGGASSNAVSSSAFDMLVESASAAQPLVVEAANEEAQSEPPFVNQVSSSEHGSSGSASSAGVIVESASEPIVVETVNEEGDGDRNVEDMVDEAIQEATGVHEASDDIIAEYEAISPGLFGDDEPEDAGDSDDEIPVLVDRHDDDAPAPKRRRRRGTSFTRKPKGKMKAEYKYEKLPAESRKRKAGRARKAKKNTIDLDADWLGYDIVGVSQADQRRLISLFYLQILQAPPPFC